jgi:hypothetical protein
VRTAADTEKDLDPVTSGDGDRLEEKVGDREKESL